MYLQHLITEVKFAVIVYSCSEKRLDQTTIFIYICTYINQNNILVLDFFYTINMISIA